MSDANGRGAASEVDVMDAIRDRVGRGAVADGTGRGAALVTVVDVRGSAYRRPGAKMVVDGDETVGNVANRCLEKEVRRVAAAVADDRAPRVESYDLRADDAGGWGRGAGCDGRVEVLVEPLDGRHRSAVAAFERGEDVAEVTAVAADRDDVAIGDRAHYRPGAGFDGGLPAAVVDPVADAADHLARDGGATTVETDGGDVTLFVDGIAAPPELVVVGSGRDAVPVVEGARRNGFRVTVVGFRGAVALDERFPAADETVTTSPAALREHCGFDEDTYVVVMTHNFVDDRVTLQTVLETDVPYVGLLGARDRFERMVETADDEGRAFAPGDLERVHAPVGLDLGGGGPERIATSVVAELLAVHADREPGHLTERDGTVHGRTGAPGTTAAEEDQR